MSTILKLIYPLSFLVFSLRYVLAQHSNENFPASTYRAYIILIKGLIYKYGTI